MRWRDRVLDGEREIEMWGEREREGDEERETERERDIYI